MIKYIKQVLMTKLYQVENMSKEIEIINKKQMKTLETKSRIIQVSNSLEGLNGRI